MGGHILYGQGNFHFVWHEAEDEADNGYMWNTGLLAQIDIDNDLKIKFIPCVVDNLSVRCANIDEANQLLTELDVRSQSLKDGTWYDKWREFAISQERYRAFPQEMYEEIAHYFDCEAHTDVCKEIYQTYNATNEDD